MGSVCALGPVEEVICDRTQPEKCDLIAFAPRGHSGLTRWLYGSVSEGVIRQSPCPGLLEEGIAHFWKGSIMEQVARSANCPVLVFPPGS